VAATLFAVAATALLGVGLELVLWRPMRHRGAGLVALLITSIGLALVLRHAVFLLWGQPRRYDTDVFQVYDLGVIRLSRSQLLVVAIAAAASPPSLAVAMSESRVWSSRWPALWTSKRVPPDRHQRSSVGAEAGQRRGMSPRSGGAPPPSRTPHR
jgi:hypothetical protein